jgi:hypothetical protein
MAWLLARNNKNQLKRGKLITADGKEYERNYEELTTRKYGVQNDIIQGMDYISALQTIRLSAEGSYTLHDKFQTEDATIPYSIKRITPETNNAKSRYARNQIAWVLDLGE